MRLVSDQAYLWIVYAAIVGICLGWGARDVYLLRTAWGKPDPVARDQVFGSIMGLVICAIGLIGLFRHVRAH